MGHILKITETALNFAIVLVVVVTAQSIAIIKLDLTLRYFLLYFYLLDSFRLQKFTIE